MLPPTSDANEAGPVIDYITGEMNTNATGQDAFKMRELNTYNGEACIAEWQKFPLWKKLLTSNMPRDCMQIEMSSRQAALAMWVLNVRQNGPWDHKPVIRKRFHPRVPNGEQVWHRIGPSDYYYDIWSNVHYGYVGKACGFSDSALLDGAGLEQIGSDLFRGRLPGRRAGIPGVRAFDDSSDQESIAIGIRLFKLYPCGVTAQQVRDAVTSSGALTKRPTPAPARAASGPR